MDCHWNRRHIIRLYSSEVGIEMIVLAILAVFVLGVLVEYKYDVVERVFNERK